MSHPSARQIHLHAVDLLVLPLIISSAPYLSVEGLRPLDVEARVALVEHLAELRVGLLHEAVGLPTEAHEGWRPLADALLVLLVVLLRLLLLLLVLTALLLAAAISSAVRLGAPTTSPAATATASAWSTSTPIPLLCHAFPASAAPPGAETGGEGRVGVAEGTLSSI